MKFIMIDAFKGASGKLCGHSDMGATFIGRTNILPAEMKNGSLGRHSDMGVTYVSRTGATYSHKLCNKRNLAAMPYSEKELSQQSTFKARSAVICVISVLS